MADTLRMFMWGYQTHFRALLRSFAEESLRSIGVHLPVTALLIGVARPGVTGALPVCIEPEADPVTESLFDGLDLNIRANIANHPHRNRIYGDEVRAAEKPEFIRRDSTRAALRERLDSFDARTGMTSEVGYSQVIGNYDVFPVLRFTSSEWQPLISLKKTVAEEFPVKRGLAEAMVTEVLGEAREQLGRKDPGRGVSFDRDLADIQRAAGKRFMYVAGWAVKNVEGAHGLLDRFSAISSLRYEGTETFGEVLLGPRGHHAVEVMTTFRTPIPVRDPGWARKVVQMSSSSTSVLCDGLTFFGLGHLATRYESSSEEVFHVRFVGHFKWDLVHANTPLMRVSYGIPTLPPSRLEPQRFKSNAMRVLGPKVQLKHAERLFEIVSTALTQNHGTLIVVTPQAEVESLRLQSQATAVAPLVLDEEMIRRVTNIDGALLLDTEGTCHAVGVILDGRASPSGTPSRGARYNSAVRYVESIGQQVLAIVVSEDGRVDVVPELRPQISRSLLNANLDAARQTDSKAETRKMTRILRWFDDHRFYLREEECIVANDLRVRRDAVPLGTKGCGFRRCRSAIPVHVDQ